MQDHQIHFIVKSQDQISIINNSAIAGIPAIAKQALPPTNEAVTMFLSMKSNRCGGRIN
jgi:hypothetical protein